MGIKHYLKAYLLKKQAKRKIPIFDQIHGLTPLNTHVQYTQTDTIRQTDGPLVPMVGLVPIEKDVIAMVLLVNMHLIKGT